MSIKTEIDRIKQSKADIISALETKGVTVPSDASIDDLSALVEAIEVGSSGITPSGELAITENGTYDVTNYASANVNVASSGGSDGGSIKTTDFRLVDYTWWHAGQAEPSWTLTLTRYIDEQFSIITGKKSSLEEQYGDESGWIPNVVVGSTVIIKDNTGEWTPNCYVFDNEIWEGVIIDGKGHLVVHENGEHVVEGYSK